jgi:hypothetical protein
MNEAPGIWKKLIQHAKSESMIRKMPVPAKAGMDSGFAKDHASTKT